MISKLMIELVIRKLNNQLNIEKFKELIQTHLTSELDDKLILSVSLDWVGFKDGTMSELLRVFDETIYVALAYVASGNEIVTDIYGDYVDKYNIVIDGRKTFKYVKKNLRIMSILDKENQIFEIKSYILDLKVSPPIVKILDVYSGSMNSGIRLNDFVSGNR